MEVMDCRGLGPDCNGYVQVPWAMPVVGGGALNVAPGPKWLTEPLAVPCCVPSVRTIVTVYWIE